MAVTVMDGLPWRRYGKTGNDLHFHVLVTGLLNWHADQRLDFMRRLESHGCGDARIDPYTSGDAGLRYILEDHRSSNHGQHPVRAH